MSVMLSVCVALQANKCYRELHIGLDSSLRTYTVLEGDESLQRQKVNAMARFQRWALLAQQRSEASTNATAVLQHPPVRPLSAAGSTACSYTHLAQVCSGQGWVAQPCQPLSCCWHWYT